MTICMNCKLNHHQSGKEQENIYDWLITTHLNAIDNPGEKENVQTYQYSSNYGAWMNTGSKLKIKKFQDSGLDLELDSGPDLRLDRGRITWILSVGRFLSGVRSPEEVFSKSNAIVAISVIRRQSLKVKKVFQGTWSMFVTIFLRHPRGNHVCVIHFVNLDIEQN